MSLRTVLLLIISLAIGSGLLFRAEGFAAPESRQLVEYNKGYKAYRNGQYELAVEYFRKSTDEYQAALEAMPRQITLPGSVAVPSRLYAGWAHHHRARALVKSERYLDALGAFMESQRVNPGDCFPESVTPDEARCLRKASFECKKNMEAFLQLHPEFAPALQMQGRPSPTNDGPINNPTGTAGKGRPEDDI